MRARGRDYDTGSSLKFTEGIMFNELKQLTWQQHLGNFILSLVPAAIMAICIVLWLIVAGENGLVGVLG